MSGDAARKSARHDRPGMTACPTWNQSIARWVSWRACDCHFSAASIILPHQHSALAICAIFDFDGLMKQFTLILIKPSHYDDEGYVIQWLRSAIPSNTLAVLNGLALDCRERKVLGDDVDIVVTALDETNTRIRPERIAAQVKATGGLVALVGVQSNEFPRAMDTAPAAARAAGAPVCIGGFHVSGCLSMLPELPPELKEAMDLGISLFAGEAEGRLEEVLRDAWQGTLKPLYNYMADLPSLEGVPTPFLSARPCRAHGRKADEFRRRPRLPVSVLLLHHHQRARQEVAAPYTGRGGEDHPREPGAGYQALLRHRR